MPAEVHKIVDAIKRENPDYPDDKVWAIAYSTYNKTKDEKGKQSSYCDGCDNTSSDCVCPSGCHCCEGCRSNVNEAKKKGYTQGPIQIPDTATASLHLASKNKPTAKSKATRGRPHFTRKAHQATQMEGISGNDYGLGYKKEIIDFLCKSSEPTHNDVIEFAESLGCDPDALHREIYKMLSDYIWHEGTGQVDGDSNYVGPSHDPENETQNKQVTPSRDLYDPSPINMGIYSYLDRK